ncbi:MAG: response regulator [Dehalococcoidales bacterium]|nr:response regulator [Dehalococcoidales bacterium]
MANQAVFSKKKVVLVADDDPSILYAVKRVLANSCSVIEASNGEEAVDLSRRHKPDIVLMDMMMPKKDGITACAEIKANKATSAIPVVMLTGVGYELNKELATSLGASGYITKPFKPQELIDAIDQFSKS